jgi:hypothetical protein
MILILWAWSYGLEREKKQGLRKTHIASGSVSGEHSTLGKAEKVQQWEQEAF